MDVSKAQSILDLHDTPEDTVEYRTKVRAAFRARVKAVHPDRRPGEVVDAAEAGRNLAEAQRAQDVLNRASRGDYTDDEASSEVDGEVAEDENWDTMLQVLEAMAAQLNAQEMRLAQLEGEVVELSAQLRRLRSARAAVPRVPKTPVGLRWDPVEETPGPRRQTIEQLLRRFRG